MLFIEENVDLLPYNTFHIRARARRLVRIQSIDTLQELIQSDDFSTGKRLILGGGSNILLVCDTFNGLVVRNELRGIRTVREEDDYVIISAGGGENWHAFVLHCIHHGWGGVENLSLIPGTVGAAPMQNIGAYGVEVREVVESVEAVDLSTGEVRIFTNEACAFGYRESIFKHREKDKYLITAVNFRLTKKNHSLNTSYGAIREVLGQRGITAPSIKDISDAVIAIRSSKLPDPAVTGNAGSFFKNPSVDSKIHDSLKQQYPAMPSFAGEGALIKIPAAWLIEQCGWKGKTFGHIGVHASQALVLVNYGEGKGHDLWNLAMEVRDSVHEKFGILLMTEVNIIS